MSADTLKLPRIPGIDRASGAIGSVDREVLRVVTAPTMLEGEGFHVRRALQDYRAGRDGLDPAKTLLTSSSRHRP